MKRFLMLMAVAVVAAAFYVTAAPGGLRQAGPTARQFAALQKQVHTLQATTAQLKKQTKLLQNDLGANWQSDACIIGLTSDEFQDTWSQIDGLAVKVAQPTIFGPQTALNDFGACEGLSQPKVPRLPVNSTQVPSVTYYGTLIHWIHG